MSATGTGDRKGFFGRLKAGLQRSRAALAEGIATVLSRRRLDAAALQDFEDLLIRADLGVATAARIAADIGKSRFDRDVSETEIREALADAIASLLVPVEKPFLPGPGRPHVVMVVGVNGTGKTTTIGKIAKRLHDNGLKVLLAAGDTFRAAAIEQLRIWGERAGVPVIARAPGSDAAGLAFDALKEAQATGTDVLLIDTAGRLQNKKDLMEELAKIARVLGKLDATAPQSVLLVLDATTGQHALAQVEVFRDIANVTGLVVTKLDGTARGGVLVAIAEKFGLPVHFVGVGETAEDLQAFEARNFARALVGIEP